MTNQIQQPQSFDPSGTFPSWGEYASTIDKYERARPFNGPPNMSDLYNSYLSLYSPNAFQAAMMNYQNEWQSPQNQMLRYQAAGLNPYSFQAQSSASGSQGAKIQPDHGFGNLKQEKLGNMVKGISTLSGLFSTAKEIFDYINYGRVFSQERNRLTANQADVASQQVKNLQQQQELLLHQTNAAELNNDLKRVQLDWDRYWNLGLKDYAEDPETGKRYSASESPRATYMKNSTNRIASQVAQLEYMTDFLYPSQVDLNAAKKAIADYQLEIMKGNNDAVLMINTGNKTADAILKIIAYWLKQNISLGVGLKL